MVNAAVRNQTPQLLCSSFARIPLGSSQRDSGRKVRLSKRVIDDARYQGKGGCYPWDMDIRGFGLRIYPSGRKSFVVTYHHRGKQRFYTLGLFGVLTLHQAKPEALETLALARKGEDPSGQRVAGRRSPTVTDLADRHIHEHATINNKPRSVKRARQLWDRLIHR